MKAYTRGKTNQRGASLVMGLIVLVLLTLIGASALIVSNTQSRLASNIQSQTLAMASAESALSQAENWLAQPANTLTLEAFGSLAGFYAKGSAINPLTMAWNDSNSVTTDAAGNERYIIEVYAENRTLPGNSISTCTYGMPGACPNINLFRVTGRGIGQGGATRQVQSLFAIRAGG